MAYIGADHTLAFGYRRCIDVPGLSLILTRSSTTVDRLLGARGDWRHEHCDHGSGGPGRGGKLVLTIRIEAA